MPTLSEAIEQANYCVVFSGAGISTLSGIRDFRGKDGIYKVADADKIFDIHYFRTHPEYYYKNTKEFIYNLDEREASLVHLECARLEQLGYIKSVITQNIDLLHQKAGSKRVIEVHGSPTIHYCIQCGAQYPFETIAKIVKQDEIPTCKKCDGIIKPAITFFGEQLPEEAVRDAIDEASKADLMLVLGSSLVVQPAASFPIYTIRNGGKLAIVNEGATPLDDMASHRSSDLQTAFLEIQQCIQ
ncbi:NAD-dependent deacetylase [bacterium]|nr:NAD-dependent deacetylase [bacterium]